MDKKNGILENSISSLYREIITSMVESIDSGIETKKMVDKIIKSYKKPINIDHDAAVILLKKDKNKANDKEYFYSRANTTRIVTTINRRTNHFVEFQPPKTGDLLVEEAIAFLAIVEENFPPVNKGKFIEFKGQIIEKAKNIAKEMDGLKQNELEKKGSLKERLARLEDRVNQIIETIKELEERKC